MIEAVEVKQSSKITPTKGAVLRQIDKIQEQMDRLQRYVDYLSELVEELAIDDIKQDDDEVVA